MSYIVEYTTLSGKRIPILHKIFESAESAEAHGRQGVTEGNYRAYAVVEAAPKMQGDSIKAQREKDREHADAMGRHVKSGRKKTYTSTQRQMAKMRGEELPEAELKEAYIKTSKDAIDTLGALRKIGKHIETGQNTYDGNLANMFANDVYDVMSWLENNANTNDPKFKQIIDPVVALRKKAKSMERELGSGKDARFGNQIVNTLYPLMQWIEMNVETKTNEGYKVLPPMDREKYQERPGLEGPFSTLSGKVIYYDSKEGSYYDPDTDMYLSYDEFQQLDKDYSGMKDERDIAVKEEDDDRDELTKKLFPKMSPDEMKKRDQERNRAMNQQRFTKPGKPSRSREWGAYESASEGTNGTYARVLYDYREDYYNITVYKNGKEVESDDGYFGANETGNPLIKKFVDIVVKNGMEPEGLAIQDEEGKSGVFKNNKFNWHTNEAVAKIACLKCDEVSTAKAWEKNRGFCPKCKASNQGVAESAITEAETKYVIKHKKTKQVLNTHDDYATAKDELEGLGAEKADYGVYKQTKKDAALRNRNTYREATNEDISQDAHHMERDHEVQMARSQLYKSANYAIKLHSILKGISEEQGLEGWMQAKITKASDYLSSVFHALEYDELERSQSEPVPAMESAERPYVAVHAKKGKTEVTGSSSYDAAKKAAAKWKLTSTAGIDVHLADVTHVATESVDKDEIQKQIDQTEKHMKSFSGNTSSVKMKKVALQKKIAGLKAKLEELSETTTAGAIATAPMPMGKMIKRRKK
jgi:hypothetical protein